MCTHACSCTHACPCTCAHACVHIEHACCRPLPPPGPLWTFRPSAPLSPPASSHHTADPTHTANGSSNRMPSSWLACSRACVYNHYLCNAHPAYCTRQPCQPPANLTPPAYARSPACANLETPLHQVWAQQPHREAAWLNPLRSSHTYTSPHPTHTKALRATSTVLDIEGAHCTVRAQPVHCTCPPPPQVTTCPCQCNKTTGNTNSQRA
jgi:hypothetical protein